MGGGDAAVPVPWDRLRAWIDQHEAAEKARRRNGQPGPALSLQQLQAISLLINLWDDDEPAMDGRDHVSELMVLTQKRGYKPPVFQDLDPVDIPAAGVTSKRWRVVCRVPSASQFPDGFPALGYGIDDPVKGVPLFKSKKVAKQYAAKHAHAFLTNTPPSVSLPKSESTQQQQQQQNLQTRPPAQPSARARTYGDVIRERAARGVFFPPAAGQAGQAGHTSRGSDYSSGGSDDDDAAAAAMDGNDNYETAGGSRARGGSGSGSGSRASPRLSGDFASEDGPSVVARVSQLAGALGLESPRYDLVEEGVPGWFTGIGVFKGVSPMPAECTVVRNVLGKTKAKEEVARRMLRWLEGEDRRRRSVLDEVMMERVKQELD